MRTWKMAARNVMRSRRRSLVTTAAMAFALAVMINMAGLFAGMVKDIQRNATMMEMGHLQIHAPDYLDSPSLYKLVKGADRLMAGLKEQGFSAAPRLLAAGLAASGGSSAGVTIRGIDPVQEALTVQYPKHLSTGEWLSTDDPMGIVLGGKLAQMLKAGPGSEVVLVSQAADGSLANDLYKVRGVLKSVSGGTNRSGLLMTLESFRELMVIPNGVHEMVVAMPEDLDLPAAIPIVKTLALGLDAKSWKELNPFVAQWMKTSDAFLLPVILIMYLAVAIVILNAMLMAVFERIREYGVMKALGVTPFGVFRLVVGETVVMTLVAAAAGLAVGLPLLFYLQSNGIDMSHLGGDITMSGVALESVWRAEITVKAIALPLSMLFVLSGLAVLYPAAKAARLNPIDAIRHQ